MKDLIDRGEAVLRVGDVALLLCDALRVRSRIRELIFRPELSKVVPAVVNSTPVLEICAVLKEVASSEVDSQEARELFFGYGSVDCLLAEEKADVALDETVNKW